MFPVPITRLLLLSPRLLSTLNKTQGVAVHVAIVSARCPYLAGHVEAALKDMKQGERNGNDDGGEQRDTISVSLEHGSAETLALAVRFMYTDEVPLGISGETLNALAGLAKELMIPR